MISGIGQGENENHDTMHRFAVGFFAVADFGFAFALVAFFGAGFFAGAFFAVGFLVVAFLATGFFFVVAMIYSPLAVVTANLFLAAYSRLFPKTFSRL